MITGVGLVVDDFEELARDVLTRSGFRENFGFGVDGIT